MFLALPFVEAQIATLPSDLDHDAPEWILEIDPCHTVSREFVALLQDGNGQTRTADDVDEPTLEPRLDGSGSDELVECCHAGATLASELVEPTPHCGVGGQPLATRAFEGATGLLECEQFDNGPRRRRAR